MDYSRELCYIWRCWGVFTLQFWRFCNCRVYLLGRLSSIPCHGKADAGRDNGELSPISQQMDLSHRHEQWHSSRIRGPLQALQPSLHHFRLLELLNQHPLLQIHTDTNFSTEVVEMPFSCQLGRNLCTSRYRVSKRQI